ncbi:MAG TPA: hypothetical protein VGR57_17925, partial [Ktedonobacterales bacterium]|nr:hypothetical protein [Ktedonobacterales bacterium]
MSMVPGGTEQQAASLPPRGARRPPAPSNAAVPPAGRRHLARPPTRSPRRRAGVLALLVGAVLIMSLAYAGVTIASEALRP